MARQPCLWEGMFGKQFAECFVASREGLFISRGRNCARLEGEFVENRVYRNRLKNLSNSSHHEPNNTVLTKKMILVEDSYNNASKFMVPIKTMSIIK